jgi:cytochrome b
MPYSFQLRFSQDGYRSFCNSQYFSKEPTMNIPESAPLLNETRVWDPVVRIFHWSLVATFTIAWLTGEEESRLHELAGYAVIGLVLIRVAWGFVGTKYARFRDFVYRPSTVLAYVKDILTGKSKRYLGHNPLGGMMIVALLLSASITGLALQNAEEGTGPFAVITASTSVTAPAVIAKKVADDDGDGTEETWKELHEFFANLSMLLVVLHIAGVIVGSLVHRENLARAMFTGRKPV